MRRGESKVGIFIEVLKSSLRLVFKCECYNNHNLEQQGKDFEARGSKSVRI